MRPKVGLSLLATALLATAALAVSRWEPIGPFGHDGYRLYPTANPAIIYSTTHYSGLYRSTDGGRSWREMSPLNFGALGVHPRSPNLLIGAPGIYDEVVRSADGGRTWVEAGQGLLHRESRPHVISFERDLLDPDVVYAATEFGLFRSAGSEWEPIAFPGFAVSAFAIDRFAPEVWHAATIDPEFQGPGELQISRNAGATWSRAPGEIDRRFVTQLVADPLRPHRVYALSNCRPLAFAGGAWSALPLPASAHTCALGVTDEGKLVAAFFTSRRQGVGLSDDGGETWELLGGPGDVFFRIAATGAEPEVLMASGGRGLWRSTDGGRSWRPASRGISGFVVGDVEVAADGTVFASPGGEGVFRSRDGGRSWQRLVRGLHADARGTPALAVDPRDAQVVWAGGRELFRSRDGGESWQGLSLPRGVADRTVEEIVLDPTREGVVFVRTYAPVGVGVVGWFVYRSRDDGRSWEPLPRFHRDLAAVAVAPSDGTVYASTSSGIHASRDAGSTWRRVQAALPWRVTSIAVDPLRSHILWLGTGDVSAGVVRSVDGGRTFRPLLGDGDLLFFGGVGKLVFDPRHPSRPYASVPAQGIYQWRGAGWQRVGTADERFEATVTGPLALDPASRALYAGTSTRGIYRLPSP